MAGLDAWHGILMTTVSALSAVVGVLWQQSNTLRKQLDKLHAEHKTDIKSLTKASLELGLSVLARARPPSGYSGLLPPSDREG